MSDDKNDEPPPHPLQRNAAAGMNPVHLLTGFYGARGERIRHRVHEGALRLPEAALQVYDETNNAEEEERERGGDNPKKKAKATNKQPKPQKYKLPSLDSVQRPSLDESRLSYTVTTVQREETVQETIDPATGTVQSKRSIYRMVASNRTVVPAARIRGGGGDGGDGDEEEETDKTVDSPTEEAPVPDESVVAPNDAPAVAAEETAEEPKAAPVAAQESKMEVEESSKTAEEEKAAEEPKAAPAEEDSKMEVEESTTTAADAPAEGESKMEVEESSTTPAAAGEVTAPPPEPAASAAMGAAPSTAPAHPLPP